MRFTEESGAKVDAIGVESRVEVPLLPTEAQGVARVVGQHHIQVSILVKVPKIQILRKSGAYWYLSFRSCDAKNCPVVGTIRGDGNRLSCFICNYDLCEMCANR